MLQKEKETAEKELADTNKAMLAFKQTNGMLSFDTDKGNIVTERLGELSAALTKAQLDTLDAKVLYDAMVAAGDDSAKFKQILMSDRGVIQSANPADNAYLWQEYRRLTRAVQDARDRRELAPGSSQDPVA